MAGFTAEPGYGVRAEVEGKKVLVGNIRMMEAAGIPMNGLIAAVERLQSEAKTAMLVAVDQQVAGVIAVADTIRSIRVGSIAPMT